MLKEIGIFLWQNGYIRLHQCAVIGNISSQRIMGNIEFSPKYRACAIVLNPFKCKGAETFFRRRLGSKTVPFFKSQNKVTLIPKKFKTTFAPSRPDQFCFTKKSSPHYNITSPHIRFKISRTEVLLLFKAFLAHLCPDFQGSFFLHETMHLYMWRDVLPILNYLDCL